jgi:hypothetical protein
MSQSLEIDLKTNSDVPQAMDKAKAATESFNKQVEKVSKTTKRSMDASKESTVSVGKQVDEIGKKFSMSFKDIFLSFLGPMALVTAAISIISRKIEENQKKQQDANQAAIDGTNELISKEEQYWAKKRDLQKKATESKEQAQLSTEMITKDFLLNDPVGRAYLYTKQGGKSQEQLPSWLKGLSRLTGSEEKAAGLLSKSPEAQMFVKTALMSLVKDNPLTGQSVPFKSPEGFGNVIGVGPNPVLEAMNEQVELARQQLTELQKISGTSGVPTDFTKTPSK